MLSLAEYVSWSAELRRLAEDYSNRISKQIEGLPKAEQVRVTRLLLEQYRDDYRKVVRRALEDVALNSVGYYADKLDVEIDVDQTAQNIVDRQYNTKYHSSTLTQRHKILDLQTFRRVAVASNTINSVEKLAKVPIDQYGIDRRLLQGTAVKVENDAARGLGQYAGIQLVRWNLSHRHSQPDICDELANQINSDVVRYMQENNIHEDPKGLFMLDKLPTPPHPNCQCEFGMVMDGRTQTTSRVRRTVNKVRSILRRLRGK